MYRFTTQWHVDYLNAAVYSAKLKCLERQRATVVAVKTDFLPRFYAHIHPLMPRPYVLLTGHSDLSVDHEHDSLHAHLLHNESQIVHWYAVNVVRTHAKLTALPLGVNLWQHGSSLLAVWKKKKKKNGNNSSSSSTRQHLLLVNFDASTDPTKERMRINELFCSGGGGGDDKLLAHCKRSANFEDNYRLMLEYKFVLSPRGNGVDCWRTWEALLLGVVPVVRRGQLDTRVYERLPVLVVDEWRQVNASMLEANYVLIERRRKTRFYDYSRLTFEYWQRLIFKRHVFGQEVYRFRCWN